MVYYYILHIESIHCTYFQFHIHFIYDLYFLKLDFLKAVLKEHQSDPSYNPSRMCSILLVRLSYQHECVTHW